MASCVPPGGVADNTRAQTGFLSGPFAGPRVVRHVCLVFVLVWHSLRFRMSDLVIFAVSYVGTNIHSFSYARMPSGAAGGMTRNGCDLCGCVCGIDLHVGACSTR